MIKKVEILECLLHFDKLHEAIYLLLTHNNINIIGKKLEEQGFKWISGNLIFQSSYFEAGNIIRVSPITQWISCSYAPGEQALDKPVLDKLVIEYDIIKVNL